MFIGYVIFAVSTGILSYFTVHRPILNQLEKEGIFTDIMEHRFAFAVVTILVGALTAPFIFKLTLTGPDEDLTEDIRNRML